MKKRAGRKRKTIRRVRRANTNWRCKVVDQVQCPNCGGYKVEITHVEDVREKEEITVSSGTNIRRWGCFILAGIATFGLSFLFLLDRGFREGLVSGKGVKHHYVGKIYYYTCYLCGYKWEWDTRTPRPEVHIRPDLLAKSAQRLEAEEERRRQAAADAYHLYTQQHRGE
jgi:hypothetical protein